MLKACLNQTEFYKIFLSDDKHTNNGINYHAKEGKQNSSPTRSAGP